MGQASHFWKVNQYLKKMFVRTKKKSSFHSVAFSVRKHSKPNWLSKHFRQKRGERKTDKLSSLKNEIWQKCQKSSYFFFSWQMLLVKIHMEDLLCIAFFMLWRKNESIHHEERRRSSSRKICFWSFFSKEPEKRVPL